MIIKDGLTFDDVLLIPKLSSVKSRSEINLGISLSKGIGLKNPIIPANMKTVTGKEMAFAVAKNGGMAIVHRFMTMTDQLSILSEAINKSTDKLHYENHIGFSVGVKPENKEDVDDFARRGAKILCIDIAHGHSSAAIEMCKYISTEYPEIFLIAGNVATGAGATDLWCAGADAVKVGVGPGSLCTTRIETGNGVPQLTALIDVYEAHKKLIEYQTFTLYNNGDVTNPTIPLNKKMFIIADGGIKSAGDCVKALCFADLVMIGNMFAGTDEAPGDIITHDGHQYKSYVGSSTHKTNHIEGVTALVPYKGKMEKILTKLLEGISSGCSYQGVDSLRDLKRNPQFVKISSAGLRESHPHDVMVSK